MLKTHTPPSTGRLLKATAVALLIAGLILVAAVLPAEYGIDPTGIGSRLGLDALGSNAKAAEPDAASAVQEPSVGPTDPAPKAAANEAIDATAVFGPAPGQTFDKTASTTHKLPPRRETLSLTLPPGDGAEIKALVAKGGAFVFHWKASGDVAVDMHGERTNAAKDEYTSYSIERAQRESSGQFTAPFDGRHGWYWLNRGSEAVAIRIEVIGFQEKLFRPDHN